MLVIKQLLVPIDVHSKERNAMEVNETINCLITSILQNIFFFVQHKRETHTFLEQYYQIRKFYRNVYFYSERMH